MKAADCVRLEKDKGFKRSYLKKTAWWKNILLVAPVCLLFVGLVGVVYLLNVNMLASLYVIPYLVLFVVGTIWLKAIKKYIQNKAIEAEGTYLVCQARVVAEKEGYVQVVYTIGDKRHNDYMMKNIAERIDVNALSDAELLQSKKSAVMLHDDEADIDLYFRTYFHNDISRRNPDWRDNAGFPVLYIDARHVEIIKKIDLM